MPRKLFVRWMICLDLAEALEIERLSYPTCPWSEEEFLAMMRARNIVGMVAECGAVGGVYGRAGRVVGFMFFELRKSSLRLISLAVHPAERRRGVGSAMVENLVGKLSPHRRTRIALDVRETNLGAQLFFRSRGFQAVGVDRGVYEDTDEDAFRFRYQLSAAPAAGGSLSLGAAGQ